MDPLLELKNAYFNTETATAPNQNFAEILTFRKAYQHPSIKERGNLRINQSNIKTTRFPEDHFLSPYAFYRVARKDKAIVGTDNNKQKYAFVCNPLHFETPVGEDFKHLERVVIDRTSEDLLAPFLTSFTKLLVGDIVAVSELWQCENKVFAAEFVCLERQIRTSDALIYQVLYDSDNGNINKGKKKKFAASSVDIPQDYASASFDGRLKYPEIDGLHAIGQCEIFIPIKEVQRFAANFINDILHPDPLIRQSCILTHQNSHRNRSPRQKNYRPVVINCKSTSSFNRHSEKFTTIDEILRKGNQEEVYNLCTMVAASLEHHRNLIGSLDSRNHALIMTGWRIRDDMDYQIGIDFRMMKFSSCFKRTRIRKKSMIKVYGILPTPLELFIEYHYETYYDQEKDKVGEENEPKKEKNIIILKTVLRIMDNIPETEDEESVGRKMYFKVLESLEKEPELIYGHLISGETKDRFFVKMYRQRLPDKIFNDIMRNSRNSESAPLFDCTPDLQKKNLFKNLLKNVINTEPTEEQIDTVYYAIHAKNSMMLVESPVGGGKTTLLAATCCIATKYYQFRQLIVCEPNGAIVSVCRKLEQFGARKVLRMTSMVAQKRNGKMLTTDYDLPTVAERVFCKILMEFDEEPDKERSSEELDMIRRCYRMLNYMHRTSSQSRFRVENIEKLRELFGYSIDSAPENPTRETVKLVFEIVKPDIIIGTANQIEQLMEHYKSIDLNVEMINIDNASVESIYSLFTLVSMLATEATKKIILFGDSCQFGPNCINLAIEDQFKTAMDVVGKGLARIEHKKMFRSQPDTVRILCDVFYDNMRIAASCPISIHLPDFIWPNPKSSLNFKYAEGSCSNKERTHIDERCMQNHFEALEIKRMCVKLSESGVQKSDIMILAFYNGQVKLLKRLLPDYTILTVRSSQGLEAKIVLVSVTRTKEWKNDDSEFSRRKPMTETHPYILVALSRAREKCLVFLDPEYAIGTTFNVIMSINDEILDG